MIHPVAGIAGVLAALGALIGGVRLYQQRFSPPPEVPRKIVHVAMGLITLSFPWVFHQVWPVLVMGGLAAVSMLALRLLAPLRQGMGKVLLSVDRESLGELYFPIAIVLLFWLAEGDTVAYVVPVLMLTLADATAAVIGLRYGMPRFQTTAEAKSIEGSAAFFFVAFLSALVPLLLFTSVGRAETLLIATILGLLLALLEAISWAGLDNLLIPLGAHVFLQVHQSSTAPQLLLRLGVLIALVTIALWWRGRTTLSHRGVITAALACYMFWVIGGLAWVAAPLALFFTYALIPPLSAEERSQPHDARVVASNVAVGLFWVFIAGIAGWPELLYASTVGFGAHLAMNSYVRLSHYYPTWSSAACVAAAAVKGVAFVLVPWALIAGADLSTGAPLVGVGSVLVGIAAGWAAFFQHRFGYQPVSVNRAWLHACITCAVSILAASALGVWMP